MHARILSSDLPEGKIIDPHESCDNINSTDRIVFLVHGFIANANTTNSYMLASQLVKVNIYFTCNKWREINNNDNNG